MKKFLTYLLPLFLASGGCKPDASGEEANLQCDDGVDNDEDGLTDCADPSCEDSTSCGDEICDDNTDNDSDERIDCADSDCNDDTHCNEAGSCTDNEDNDNDNLTDCDDSDCINDTHCEEFGAECSDGIDNDEDGAADCKDSDCAHNSNCRELGFCNDKVDNDGDGFIDCADSDCEGETNCPSQFPIANDDSFQSLLELQGTENTQLDIPNLTLLQNDIDPDSPITITAVQSLSPNILSVDFNASTVFVIPAADFSGAAEFQYTISDLSGNNDSALVDVFFASINTNNPPVAFDDFDIRTTSPSQAITFSTQLILANDFDSDSENPPTLVSVTSQGGGAVFFDQAQQTITFTPDINSSGSVFFDYTITDGIDSASAQASIFVDDHKPVATDDSPLIPQENPRSINVLGNDLNLQDTPVTVALVSLPSNGSVVISGSSISYDPNSTFIGSDFFTYQVRDADGDISTANVFINVFAVCGDGFLGTPEQCDDGGTTNGDGCSAACGNEFCGDNVVNNVTEQCDDGNFIDGDGCDSDCTPT
jgi:cysteine-rich repeat protein